jgi:hypothetical protein
MSRRPDYTKPRSASRTYAVDEPTANFIRHVARVRFNGNKSAALRFLVGRAGEIVAGQLA